MSILDDLVRAKRRELEDVRTRTPLPEIKAKTRDAEPPRGFRASLARRGEVSLIAEVKRASPVKGPFAPKLNAEACAKEYEEGGARALSVLTNRSFMGTELDLAVARAAVSLPVLRKEFVVEEYQIWESRALGADAVLLLAQVLEEGALRDFRELAEELGMDALVEAYSEAELDRAARSGAKVAGVNNRDLETFQVDLERSIRLRSRVSPDVVFVAESGIASRKDVERLGEAGVDAMLVGENLVKAADRTARVRELLGAG